MTTVILALIFLVLGGSITHFYYKDKNLKNLILLKELATSDEYRANYQRKCITNRNGNKDLISNGGPVDLMEKAADWNFCYREGLHQAIFILEK